MRSAALSLPNLRSHLGLRLGMWPVSTQMTTSLRQARLSSSSVGITLTRDSHSFTQLSRMIEATLLFRDALLPLPLAAALCNPHNNSSKANTTKQQNQVRNHYFIVVFALLLATFWKMNFSRRKERERGNEYNSGDLGTEVK